MNHKGHCSGDARNYCKCAEDPGVNDYIEVPVEDWRRQKKENLTGKVLSTILLFTNAIAVADAIHNEKIVYKDKIVSVEKIVYKDPPVTLDPEIVSFVKSRVTRIHQLEDLIPNLPLNKASECLDRVEINFLQIKDLPIKERLEAHKQLGY